MKLVNHDGDTITLITQVANITQLSVDAIVNPANPMLRNGGGVAGAIYQAAGPALEPACAKIGGCEQGEAVITPGFDLPAAWIIHTPSPIWRGGHAGETAVLTRSYANTLRIADRQHCTSIAFPILSAGNHHFPLTFAISIAITAITSYIVTHQTDLRTIIFCDQSTTGIGTLTFLLETT